MDFSRFLHTSPTSFHAVEQMKGFLADKGFVELNEREGWDLKPGTKIWIQRGGALLAGVLPSGAPSRAVILGAHTDSPAFKLKPTPEYLSEGCVMLGVEVYGGPLLNSWLNRELGLSGRLLLSSGEQRLVSLTEHPFIIPQLAIHLDREVNDGLKLNKQEHLPVLASIDGERWKEGGYLESILGIKKGELFSHDLYFHPLEEPKRCGHKGELLQAYRLDNLASCHQVLMALADQKSDGNTLKLGLFWDHEEIGSATAEGAGSPILDEGIERLCIGLKQSREQYLRLKRGSLLVSVDMAHAVHPNYGGKHEAHHKPHLGGGPVLKLNAQQRYATNTLTGGQIALAAHKAGVKLQHFVAKNDMPCGSTVGPISSTRTGIATADLGAPQLSMHSAREVMAMADHEAMIQLLKGVYTAS